MKNKEKKMAAAIAAVNLYLQEEEMAQAAALAITADAAAGLYLNQASQWTLTTRLDMMATNRMLQMRAFSRTR